MIYKGTHTCLYKVKQLKWMSEQKLSPEVKGMAFRTERQDCVWDRSGKDYKKKKLLCWSSQEHLASVILNGWSLKQSGLFLDLASWPNWAIEGERVLVREVIKTLMVTLVELHDLIWKWEKLTEGQTSLWHSTNLGLMAKWPNSSFSSVKIHETLIGIYTKKIKFK